tara:strand:+ start:210 stop:458 length:249 start_codon:yes stop_codon:yes gene_type:complete
MSYHLRSIEKGTIGELSKVYEEIEEVKDSDEQGVDLMVLVELSDVIGAIESYLEKHHKSISLTDLIVMSDVTKRAFRSGRRS